MPRSRRAGIARGVADSLGVGIGIFPLGVALGVLVVQAGLPGWVAPALSIGIFAGSVELLLVSLLAATTPILTIAVTVLAMNFRHVFYALSFPLDRVSPGIPRAYSVYALIDEAYATYVLLPAGQLSSARIVAGQLLMQAYWVAGGLLGVALAGILPARLEGLEFALVALFVVMTLDAARSRNEVPSLLLAGLSVGVALLAFPGQALPAALIVYTALLALRFVLARGSDDGPDGDVSRDGPSGGSRDGGSGGAAGSATDGARRGDPGSAASGADA
ncbi:AzlC family ABC transporter permease [Leucobacter allii]|uniref:AzlC family ABC transporter permease n=1 Tax=Leucobacter allii TaxID=2932247 RepID=A0ABY4FPP5_9MICO|nr:AzlC family ABC transporter permease [Leucobacter allii]UOQ58253.1 AzlC family ABC transporter permease [Leucobacter allii]